MAGAAIFTDGILLILILLIWVTGGLIQVGVKLGLVRLLRGRSAMRHRFARLHHGGMMAAGHSLHGNRNGQCIAAEKRQPDGHDQCNKFSGDM